MIKIDKTDALYKYLTALGVGNIDDVYLELAQNGRFKLDDVRQYFRATFAPSQTEDVSEQELEKVLDYYVDIKKLKHLNTQQVKKLLEEYKKSNDAKIKELIINSQLKDILYLCLNYSTLHKDVDIQDLVQTANLGLLEAIEKYNPQARVEFKDYMVYYVREIILNSYKEKTNG
ncbi:MAG: hypothetical protein IJW36_01595 [Clostridia bacterium]|nr:hypothetical protein [Clostridia bacterium]